MLGPRTIISSFTYALSASSRNILTIVAELILNGLTTLLGDSVGRVFQSLFPPMPQFKGRQVVTLHNQRDFLFFRRHRLVSSLFTIFVLWSFRPPLSSCWKRDAELTSDTYSTHPPKPVSKKSGPDSH